MKLPLNSLSQHSCNTGRKRRSDFSLLLPHCCAIHLDLIILENTSKGTGGGCVCGEHEGNEDPASSCLVF